MRYRGEPEGRAPFAASKLAHGEFKYINGIIELWACLDSDVRIRWADEPRNRHIRAWLASGVDPALSSAAGGLRERGEVLGGSCTRGVRCRQSARGNATNPEKPPARSASRRAVRASSNR